MASSLIGGLIEQGFAPDLIIASDIDQGKLVKLQQDYSVRTETDNDRAIQQSDIVILAIKPQIMQQVCRAITETAHNPLFISIAAGVRATDIDRWLGGGRALVRCMPNTPALVGLGASALFANSLVNPDQRQQAEQIMQSTGISVWVDEEAKLDAVTAISGSGPAYFFLFIEALQNAATALGLEPDIAAKLARQTALGAATMALDQDVVSLRQQVTSKGGTTERAIASFEQSQLQQIVLQAAQAAQQRSVELAEELSG